MPLRPTEDRKVWAGPYLGARRRDIGELCALADEAVVASGPEATRRVGDLATIDAEALFGAALARKYAGRLPLMVKLLNVGDWLSVQAHPNDAQAALLAGAGASGKTEAWHILRAEPGARLAYGLRPGATRAALLAGLREATLESQLRFVPVRAGDTFLVQTGMIHALGPGMLVYEVAQHTSLTYRLYDWDRPATTERPLHVKECLAVVNCTQTGAVSRGTDLGREGRTTLTISPYFELAIVRAPGDPHRLSTEGLAFHALTAAAGSVTVECSEGRHVLHEWETLLAPACIGDYTIQTEADGGCLVAVPR
jgi:mannose-6-phosphate isomerase